MTSLSNQYFNKYKYHTGPFMTIRFIHNQIVPVMSEPSVMKQCTQDNMHDISLTAWCMVLFGHSVMENSISVDIVPAYVNWEFAYSV